MKFKELKEMYMRQYLVYNLQKKKKPQKPKTHANFQLLYKSSKKCAISPLVINLGPKILNIKKNPF